MKKYLKISSCGTKKPASSKRSKSQFNERSRKCRNPYRGHALPERREGAKKHSAERSPEPSLSGRPASTCPFFQRCPVAPSPPSRHPPRRGGTARKDSMCPIANYGFKASKEAKKPSNPRSGKKPHLDRGKLSAGTGKRPHRQRKVGFFPHRTPPAKNQTGGERKNSCAEHETAADGVFTPPP